MHNRLPHAAAWILTAALALVGGGCAGGHHEHKPCGACSTGGKCCAEGKDKSAGDKCCAEGAKGECCKDKPAEAPAKPAPAPRAPFALVAQVTTEAAPQPAAAPAATQDASDEAKKAADEAKARREEAEKKAKEARERARKRKRLQRELEMAGIRHEKQAMSHEFQTRAALTTLERTRSELEVAVRRLDNLTKESIPTRLARTELSLQYAQDGVKEAEEELTQLEMMYKEEQLADQTKEIVLERSRRRLDRSRRSLTLSTAETKNMREFAIPLEIRDAEQAVDAKKREVEKLEFDQRTAEIDQKLALLSAEAEMERLRHELEDLEEEERKAAQEADAAAGKAP